MTTVGASMSINHLETIYGKRCRSDFAYIQNILRFFFFLFLPTSADNHYNTVVYTGYSEFVWYFIIRVWPMAEWHQVGKLFSINNAKYVNCKTFTWKNCDEVTFITRVYRYTQTVSNTYEVKFENASLSKIIFSFFEFNSETRNLYFVLSLVSFFLFLFYFTCLGRRSYYSSMYYSVV